jgi:hypothetical protein
MKRSILVCLLLLTTVLALPVAGQNVSATLSGTVRDSSGAIIPGATVTVTKTDTGTTRVVQSNAEGYFVFSDLPAGTYSVSVELRGFKTYRQEDIRLTAGQIRTLGDIAMQLGQVAETVTVEATAAPVDLGSGEKSGLVTGEDLDRTAIRGRDFLDMLRLLPGIVDETEGREAPGPDGIRNIFINGARDNQKNMTVDGVTNMDTGSNGTTHTAPTIDMIQEVKVLTSAYQAEFGRAVGGTIIVTTRGGTQQYRGSASWSWRHESINANDYFNNQKSVTKPPYRFNTGAWSLGGPVIPKDRKHSRLFFFFSQELTRQKMNYGTQMVRMPNLLERQGDFSQTFDLNNALIPIQDPLLTMNCSTTNRTNCFPNNIVPKERQNKIGQAILNMFPKPNFVDPVATRVNQWNYVVTKSGAYPRRSDMVRIDFNPTQRWNVFVRYTNNYDEQHVPWNTPSGGSCGPCWIYGGGNYDGLGTMTFRQPGRGLAMNITRAIGASFMNQLMLGYSMNRLTSYPDYPEQMKRGPLGITLSQWRPWLNAAGWIPNMTFGVPGTSVNASINNSFPYKNVNHIFSVSENLRKSHGTHALSAGVYIERTRKDQVQGTPVRGTISFSDDSNNPLRTRYAFASALMGIMTSYQEATTLPYGLYRFTNLEWYVQDNWKVKRGLTLDYGIRFYHNLPQAEIRGGTSAFVQGLYSLGRAPLLVNSGRNAAGTRVAINALTGEPMNLAFLGTFAPGSGDTAIGMVSGGTKGYPKTLYTVPGLSIGPRVGFAYNLFGKGNTSIRGGAGIFFDRIQGNPTMNMLTNPPGVYSPMVYYTTFDDFAASAGSGVLAPSTISHSLYGEGRLPTTYQYTFGIQHAATRTTWFEVAYVGNVARHLLWQRNINPVPAGATLLNLHPENRDPTNNAVYANNFLRSYRGYGDIFEYEFGGTSSYNSLQSAFTTRLGMGLFLRTAYTFSKTLGSAVSDTTQVSPFFKPRDRNYGRLRIDRDHVFTMSYTWMAPRRWLPDNRWLRRPLDGWEFNGTTMFSRGQALTPGFGTVDGMNFTGTGSEGARMLWLGGENFARPALPRPSGVVEELYWGNVGPGIWRGPGINNWDMRITRRFRLSEKGSRSLEFRGEFFNFANHTQFSGIDSTARFDQQGSQINTMFLEPSNSRRPRQIQFALKLYF